MPINQFTAFYPSKPFWAGNKVDFSDQSRKSWFHDQMEEEVFSHETSAYTIKICRDGRIMLRIEALEKVQPNEGNVAISIDATVKTWGKYLDFLNAFYLLLDSATIEISKVCYFNLHEITNRDAFRVHYEGGKCIGENIAMESIASVFQMGRYLSSYRSSVPIQNDPKITMRHVITLDVIQYAVAEFTKVIATSGLEKTLSSFAKSLSEYKVGNYETSIILSWFITEAALSQLWKNHIDILNTDFLGGRKRINRDRKDFLTGRDFTISMILNLLELWGALPHAQFQDIDAVRGFRNKIVHNHNFAPGMKEAQLALNTAKAMVDRIWGLRFTPSLGYSVTGL
jgi:hypothetical protein